MPDLPLPALTIIAQFMFPKDLLLLSRVNKSWFTAFTSDKAWYQWDAFGREKDICSHYIECKEEDESLYLANEYEGQVPNCAYGLLARCRRGNLRHCDRFSLRWVSRSFNVALSRSQMKLDHIYFEDLMPFSRTATDSLDDDSEIVYGLLCARIDPNGMDGGFAQDHRASLLLLSMPDPRENVHSSFRYFDWWLQRFAYKTICADREFALKVVTANHLMYFLLPEEFQVEPEVFDAQLKLMKSIPEKVRWGWHISQWGWTMPRKLAESKSRVMALFDAFPEFVEFYSKLCIQEEMKPDMNVLEFGVATFDRELGRGKGTATSCPTLPEQALQDRDFVINVLEKYWLFLDLQLLPETLRIDDDVLRLTFEKCQYVAYGKSLDLPEIAMRVYALFVAGLQLPAEMETLRKVVGLPEETTEALLWPVSAPKDGGKSHRIQFEGIARMLYTMVHQDFDSRPGAGLPPFEFYKRPMPETKSSFN